MNIERLYQILKECTVQLRKGPAVTERVEPSGLRVQEIFGMPHESDAAPGIEKVDMEFLVIGVDKVAAETRRAELVEILKTYPQPERLAAGPSYIEVGGMIGDQGRGIPTVRLGQGAGALGRHHAGHIWHDRRRGPAGRRQRLRDDDRVQGGSMNINAATAHGWAVVQDGRINVRTVSDTRRAAIVNWLVVETRVMVFNHDTDEAIEKAWHAAIDDKTICTTVSIKASGGGQ